MSVRPQAGPVSVPAQLRQTSRPSPTRTGNDTRGRAVTALLALLAGSAIGIDLRAAHNANGASQRVLAGALYVVVGANVMLTAFFGLRRLIPAALSRLALRQGVLEAYRRYDAVTYAVFALFALGLVGVRFIPAAVAAVLGLFVAAQVTLVVVLSARSRELSLTDSRGFLLTLFFLSGMAALMYQVVWQRLLFAAFGVDIQTVTVVVSVFMFGLGLGAIFGGWLAARAPGAALKLFVAFEVTIGGFGLASKGLIAALAEATQLSPLPVVMLACFALLGIPTLLMGATLPILVQHLQRTDHHVGRAVGLLYGANTLGSAVACFVTAGLLFALTGLQATLIVAGALNFAVSALALRRVRGGGPAP